ncbi:MAG: low molecular weight protein-tyrosine-phosphatase [Hydrogenophaga sp.]|uniref:low molecular weight protein-tyrosine-phosphatase n=1 Tax=Hydrogenophaga sp. TaxID=1904254 RepID=UPI003D10F499
MYRILVVCMGNICRSPLAESVMQADLARLQLTHSVEVDSAGTYGGHQGEKPDRRAIELARSRGYAQIETQRARRVRTQDFESFDLILAMDRHNLDHLRQQCPPDQQHKLHLFLNYAGLAAPDEVPDPYYGNAEGFSAVLDLCERGSQGVLRRVALELA